MVQITGRQTGTPQNNTFAGELRTFDVEESSSQAGIINATINGLGGRDFVEGVSTLQATSEAIAPGVELEANGISQSTISGDLDNDIVLATGIGVGSLSEPTEQLSVIATGRGLFRSATRGGNGEDEFVFIGSGIEGLSSTGIGLEDSSADGGGGADDITVEGFARSAGNSAQTLLTAIGTRNGVITGGGQDDDITIEAETDAFRATELNNRGSVVIKAADASFISGDGGSDEIAISSQGGVFSNADVAAVSSSEVRGGAGNDNLDIISSLISGNEGDIFADTVTSSAVEKGSLISGDAGADSLSITTFNTSSVFSTAYGVNDSQVEGGNGNDFITVNILDRTPNGEAFGLFNAEVDGGNDNDRIFIEAELNGSNASGAAASQSVVSGGSGNDDIAFIVGVESAEDVGDITGLSASEVYGNSGNDRILVSTEGPVDYNINDSLLFGGAGDDRFNVGIGNGKIVGGEGDDTAVLDYLETQPVAIAPITNGIRVSGTQTQLGTAGDWSQDILGVENYLVNGTAFTNESLVQTFG